MEGGEGDAKRDDVVREEKRVDEVEGDGGVNGGDEGVVVGDEEGGGEGQD